MPYVAGGELFYHLRQYHYLYFFFFYYFIFYFLLFIIYYNFDFGRFRTFNEKVTQFYIAEIVLALEHVHSKKICYRDLKVMQSLFSFFTSFGLFINIFFKF
jgi:serine/threonine protein kinase